MLKNTLNALIVKLNLSSALNFIVVLVACVTVTCALSVIMTSISFYANVPEMMAMYGYEIQKQTIITTSILGIFFFTVFLYLLRHIDQLRKILAKQLRRDSLTGLLTREAFFDDFNKGADKNENGAFLLIDADFFKSINDTHGHLAGDKALVAITSALKKGIRKSDTIGRIGGEEFGVHLSDVDYDLAVKIAERLRKNVKQANLSFELDHVDLSVSVGAVIYKEKTDLISLMNKADELLYKAKGNGRNRVEHQPITGAAFA